MEIWGPNPSQTQTPEYSIMHKALGGASISRWSLERRVEHYLACVETGQRSKRVDLFKIFVPFCALVYPDTRPVNSAEFDSLVMI